ncbi:MAG: hypothetical protein ACR2G9_05540, partial [Gaiellaceae bacterium]
MCCEHCSSGDALIDAAIAEGRIDASSRETYLRTYEHSPDFVVEALVAAKPDIVLATRNYQATISDEEDAAHRAYISTTFGI